MTKKHIRAFVSLGVIFVMILHLGVPHAHHHHEYKEVVAHTGDNDHHHTDDRQHHPKYHNTDKNTGETGFELPSEKHLHAFHVHEFIPSSKNQNHTSPIKAFPLLSVITDDDYSPWAENKKSYRYALFRQIIYENPFLLNCSLRAPPYST